jgi:1-acyl-sn-glycerol-3-phosphate acyltransferase
MNWQRLGPELPKAGNWLTLKIGRILFGVLGWKIEGTFPDHPKLIVAVAPHSSNLDWLLSICVIWGLGLKSSYLIKHTFFQYGLGSLLNRLGGIPVDRRAPGGMVGQMAERFSNQAQLVLGITPEGTRSGVREWKPGFALIAQAAEVPILPAVLNYETRTVSFHPAIVDVGNVETTITQMKTAAASGVPKL